jgi:HK97 family phage major capsid protein
VRADIMDRGARQVAPLGASAPALELTEKEQKRYSLGRAVQAQASGDWRAAGFEREVSATIAKRLGRAAAGFYVPTDAPLFNAAVMTSTSAGKGAELVYSEYKGFVDLLRNRSVLARLGATMETGLQGTYSYVRQIAGSSVSWVGENPGADAAESDLGFQIVESNPKTAAGLLRYTRQQLVQSVESFDALVRRDLLATHAVEMDRVGLVGSGAAGQPLGLTGYAGVGAYAYAGAPTYPKLVAHKARSTSRTRRTSARARGCTRWPWARTSSRRRAWATPRRSRSRTAAGSPASRPRSRTTSPTACSCTACSPSCSCSSGARSTSPSTRSPRPRAA